MCYDICEVNLAVVVILNLCCHVQASS